MRRLGLFLLILIPIISLSATRVLVIYESDYSDDSIIDLPLAKKDALNVFSFFKKLPNTKVKLLENPTLGAFVSKFKSWAKTSEKGDTLVFYYAGHGIPRTTSFTSSHRTWIRRTSSRGWRFQGSRDTFPRT